MPFISACKLHLNIISRQFLQSGKKYWRTVCHWCSLKTNADSGMRVPGFSALIESYYHKKEKKTSGYFVLLLSWYTLVGSDPWPRPITLLATCNAYVRICQYRWVGGLVHILLIWSINLPLALFVQLCSQMTCCNRDTIIYLRAKFTPCSKSLSVCCFPGEQSRLSVVFLEYCGVGKSSSPNHYNQTNVNV